MSSVSFAPPPVRTVAIHVKDYGAVGDGTTDDSTAFVNAIAAANAARIPLFLDNPSVSYLASNLTLPTGLTIEGGWTYGQLSTFTMTAKAGAPLFNFPVTAVGLNAPATEITFKNFSIQGGASFADKFINAVDGIIWLAIKDVFIQGNGVAGTTGLFTQCINEEWDFERFTIYSCDYGIDVQARVGTHSTFAPSLDKTNTRRLYISGCNINGLRIFDNGNHSATGFANHWQGTVIFSGQDGVRLNGQLQDTVMEIDTEANGTSGAMHVSTQLTGNTNGTTTISSVSNSGAQTGYANGQQITIRGGGTNGGTADGGDWVGTLSSGANTGTWTMNAAVPATLTGATINNAIYSDIVLSETHGSPTRLDFRIPSIGSQDVGSSNIRYSIDAGGISAGSFMVEGGGTTSYAYIYDPNGRCKFYTGYGDPGNTSTLQPIQRLTAKASTLSGNLAANQTGTQNTFVAVTGCSLTLTPGFWLIEANIDIQNLTTGTVTADAQLWNGSAAIQSDRRSMAATGLAGDTVSMHFSQLAYFGTTTTVSLRFQSSQTTGNFTAIGTTNNPPGGDATYIKAQKFDGFLA